MKIRILAFGKLKAKGARELADHYKKFLETWAEVEEIELKPQTVEDKSARAAIQDKEASALLERLKSREKKSAYFLLDETGKALPTRDWAQMIREWEASGLREISFCIGSSLGFSSSVKNQARGIFSFGPQTFSHELARVVLIEQLFRAWSVVKGHPYHNEG